MKIYRDRVNRYWMLGMTIVLGDFVLWAWTEISGVSMWTLHLKLSPVTIRIYEVELTALITGVIVASLGVLRIPSRKPNSTYAATA
jgi:hypothetical protein